MYFILMFRLVAFTLQMCCCNIAVFFAVRDRQRTKMERDILADLDHPFVVRLHYGQSLLPDGFVCYILLCRLALFCCSLWNDMSLTV